ncbi:MAG TPA: class I SAM-dependent methyltransferase [Candidatus Binatia bacterium]|jgi:caffeoyl-CoA O-methyltransferase|nr:class I SAM-dependent methyltransferase [Candidatus Binatia bacterium]
MGHDASGTTLRDLEREAKSEYLPIIGPAQGDELERLVRERDPRLAVEVGVMTGYATIRIARNLSEGGRLVGIEISEEMARRAEKNVERAGLAAKCDIRRGDAHDELGKLEGEVDLAFLDAEKGQYLNYLHKLEPRLAPGAIVIAAGASASSERLQKYFDHVRLSGRYESTHFDVEDDGMEVSRFKG